MGEGTTWQVIDYGATEKADPDAITDETWVLELEDIEKGTSKLLSRETFAVRKSKSTKNRFVSGDVLYGKLRPYLNKIVVADKSGVCKTEILPLRPNSAVDGRFLFYWLRHPIFLAYVQAVSYGVNMPRLRTADGKTAPFVLAPYAEQKRIADKLDTVIARVDACRERLERVPLILKRFRQSVLAAATSGALTADWRGEFESSCAKADGCDSRAPGSSDAREPVSGNESIPNSWRWMSVHELKAQNRYALAIGPFGSSLTVKDYKGSGVPLVFVREIRARS